MTVAIAALYGHLECLRYAHEHTWYYKYTRWEKCDDWTCGYAALGGHLECLRFAFELGCPFASFTCDSAASRGHMDCLRYAVLNCAPPGRTVVERLLRRRLDAVADELRRCRLLRLKTRALIALQFCPDFSKHTKRHLVQRLVVWTLER
jgi:hypothetical protein